LKTLTEEKVMIFKSNQYQLQGDAFANSIFKQQMHPSYNRRFNKKYEGVRSPGSN